MIPPKRPDIEPVALPSILHRRFRANADYALVAHDQLAPAEQAQFQTLAADEHHFGLLIPQCNVQAGVKAVGHDVARLVRELTEAQQLDGESANGLCTTSCIRLVLDGIIEVEHLDQFVSGPQAAALFESARPHAPTPAADTISQRAMRLGYEVPTDDPTELSQWLYNYNILPLAPTWLRRFEALDQVLDAFELRPGSRNHVQLGGDYLRHDTHAWMSWSRRTRTTETEAHLGYKLYLSPHPFDLVGAFHTVIDVLVEAEVPAFKLGRGPFGLLRSDKFVAYFPSWAALANATEQLTRVLTGMRSQGVPFTAPLDPAGVLSWGMDPPPQSRVAGWQERESWRLWLTNRLARALVNARATGAPVDQALSFATIRLRLDGIDPTYWVPSESVWEDTTAGQAA